MAELYLQEVKEVDEAGFRPVRATEAQLLQFNDLMATQPGRVRHWLLGLKEGIVTNLTETISPGDFPTLLGVAIQRDMIAAYKIAVADWRSYIKTGTLPNFLTHEKHKLTGNDEVLNEVLPLAPYTETAATTGFYSRRVRKYGRLFRIAWEAMLNDGMGAFADIPQRFANAVIRTQSRHATEIYAAAAGPNPLLFGAPIADVDGQNVTNVGVLPLTQPNLQRTLELMAQQTDANGEPISVRGVHVVVPEALRFTLDAILESAMIVEGGGGATTFAFPTTNIMAKQGLIPHVDPFLQVVDQSATADTTWYVFADKAGESVPGQMDFLEGHVGPDIRIKSSGSSVNPLEGDFESDAISYRVRDCHGGSVQDPRFCYAQVGP